MFSEIGCFTNLLKVSHLREKNLVRFGGAPKKRHKFVEKNGTYEWEFTLCWWGRKGAFAWVTLVFLGRSQPQVLRMVLDEDEDDEAGYHSYHY